MRSSTSAVFCSSHISNDLARLLVAELDAIMAHGYGEMRIEVEKGHADILPASRFRFKYERREGECAGGGGGEGMDEVA